MRTCRGKWSLWKKRSGGRRLRICKMITFIRLPVTCKTTSTTPWGNPWRLQSGPQWSSSSAPVETTGLDNRPWQKGSSSLLSIYLFYEHHSQSMDQEEFWTESVCCSASSRRFVLLHRLHSVTSPTGCQANSLSAGAQQQLWIKEQLCFLLLLFLLTWLLLRTNRTANTDNSPPSDPTVVAGATAAAVAAAVSSNTVVTVCSSRLCGEWS